MAQLTPKNLTHFLTATIACYKDLQRFLSAWNFYMETGKLPSFIMKIRSSETRSLSHLCAEVLSLCDACCYMHWQSLIYHLRLFCTNFPG